MYNCRFIPLIISFLATFSQAAIAESPNIHRVVAGPEAWNVNSYIIESSEGIILIDAQFLKSDAEKLANLIESFKKPFAGVIITHPHMDHFGGLGVLHDRLGNFPVYANKVTASSMSRIQQEVVSYYGSTERFGDNLERRPIAVTNILNSNQELSLAGVIFNIRDSGPGEAEGSILIYQEDLNILFAGDTFFPQMHYYLGEGRPSKVITQLKFIKKNYGTVTHILSGHNNPSRPNLIDAQLEYVQFVQSATKLAMANMANLEKSGHLKQKPRGKVVSKILERYPYYEDFGNPVEELVGAIVLGVELEIISTSK